MASHHHLVVWLVLSAFVDAQCPNKSMIYTINSTGDAVAIASACPTVAGGIEIASSVVGEISLDGVETIGNDLSVQYNAPHLTSLRSSTLKSIGGVFQLNNVSTLSTLAFPNLTSVEAIVFEVLPALPELSFTQGITQVQVVEIVRTQLNNLTGIEPSNARRVILQFNSYLNGVDLPLTNVTDELVIYQNGPDLAVNLPNLVYGNTIQINASYSLATPQLSFSSDAQIEAPNFDCSSLAQKLGPVLTCSTYPKSTSSVVGTTITSTAATATGTTVPSTATPETVSGDLSTGAKAGIGAGIGVMALVLICLLVFWFQWRKSRGRNGKELPFNLVPELPLGGHHEKSELEAQWKGAHRGIPCSQELPAEVTKTGAGLALEKDAAHSTEEPTEELSAAGPSTAAELDAKIAELGIVASKVEETAGDETQSEASEAQLEALESKLERVRRNKQRLKELQELEDLENELKEEVMKQRRALIKQ